MTSRTCSPRTRFATALVGLLAYLPIEHELNPTAHATEFFLQCLGCIGTLKNILSKALLRALTSNKPLTIHIVRKCYFTAAQLEVMRNEMNDGIARVKELMTMEQLAKNAEQNTPKPDQSSLAHSSKLAPGESTPSHRHEATKSWDK